MNTFGNSAYKHYECTAVVSHSITTTQKHVAGGDWFGWGLTSMAIAAVISLYSDTLQASISSLTL